VTREYLLQIAAGFGITYESLTGDLSTTSFASGRMGWLEFQRNIESWRWQLVVPQMLNPIWSWFLAAGSVNGVRGDGIVAHWTPPRRELIDPAKEVQGIKSAVRCGLMSPAEAIREFGYDPEEVLAETAEFYQLADSLGLVLDIDPRKVSGAGQLVQQAEPPDSSEP
jgi:capsid protein